MLIIPAIDLKDGCVVRFVQGAKNKKVYSRDPLKAAKHWVKQGALLLHVIDLDGAFTGKPKNISIAKKIIAEAGVPVQFGGGLRSISQIKSLLDAGAYRVILGTKAVMDRKFLKKAIGQFGNKVIISIDAKGDTILTKGWKSSYGGMTLHAFADELKKMGLKELIYTDTTKDGTLKGPNLKMIKSLLKSSGLKVIASGGISSLDDIRKLKYLEKNGLAGIITGKALYEGRFTLTEAMKVALLRNS